MTRRWIDRWTTVTALAAGYLIALGAAPRADAQVMFRTSMQTSYPSSFLEPPRSLRQYLKDAEQAIAEQRYSDAVVRLGDLLQREPTADADEETTGQDYFLGSDQQQKGVVLSESLLGRARKMIGALPPAAIETYELRYGPLARKTLAEATAARDWDGVRATRRKYFHTEAGYRASYLLAQHAMAEGHPLQASLLLDEVIENPRAVNQSGDSVRVLHAAARVLAGRSLDDLTLTGQTVRLGEYDLVWSSAEEVKRSLLDRYRVLEDPARRPLENYAILGGQRDRNGGSAGQMPVSNPRFMVETTASPRQDQTIRDRANQMISAHQLPPPSSMPLRVGDQLLMRTTERLVGVDYETGKRVWLFPWAPASPEMRDDDVALEAIASDGATEELLTQRVWNDVPYGHISSDGERVFLIDGLSKIETTQLGAFGAVAAREAGSGTNTLVALDLATEGKILWEVGRDADEPSLLSEAFFLGPPLPLDGKLYAMAELAGDLILVCLDPLSGKELWRQQLLAIEAGGIDSDPVRRIAGAVPTYHEGLLICPTGAGATVVMNLADRTLRWGAKYARNDELNRLSIRRTGSEDPSQLMQRWLDGVAVASGTNLLVTPVETDRLYAFDLLTGEKRFDEKTRVHSRYLAGVRDGKFFVVGPDQMRAFDIQSGNQLWSTPSDMITAGQQVSGRGVFGDGEYFLPTTSNQLLRISLEDGEVLERRTTRFPLGNLVAVDGQIISQAATTLAVAYGQASLEPMVERRLQNDPNDFEALVRKGELLIQNGKRQEALVVLERARQIQPDDDEVHMLSVSAMLGTLREDPTAQPGLVESLEELIDQPSQRAELLGLRVRAALQQSDPVQAMKHLLALSELVIEEPDLPDVAAVIVDAPSRQCSLDSWITARVAESVQLADETQLASIRDQVSAAMAPLASGADTLLIRLAGHFSPLRGGNAAREKLLERLHSRQDWVAMERLALGILPPTDQTLDELTATDLLRLGKIYVENQFVEDAQRTLTELRQRSDAQSLGELESLEQIQMAAENSPTEYNWPTEVELDWESMRTTRARSLLASQQHFAPTTVTAGEHFRGWQLVGDISSPLALRDPRGMARPIIVEESGRSGSASQEAMICGGVMVVVLQNAIVAVDLFRLLQNDGEHILWTRSTMGDRGPIAKRQSDTNDFDDHIYRYRMNSAVAQQVIPEFSVGPVMGDRMMILQGGDLICLDLLTSETLWRNSSAPSTGTVLADGQRIAVVSPANNKVEFFSAYDGRKLETKAWEHGELWAGGGKHVLCTSRVPLASQPADRPALRPMSSTRLKIELVNPFTDEVVLSRESFGAYGKTQDTESAYARVIEGRYMCLLNTEGKAMVWDVIKGTEVANVETTAYADLIGVRAMHLDGQILILPERRPNASDTDVVVSTRVKEGRNHHAADAVFAISLDDGSLRWSKEFEEPWGCTVYQPPATPLLVLSRDSTTYAGPRDQTRTMDMVALGVRAGEVAKKVLDKNLTNRTTPIETRVTVQPQRQRVICQIGLEILTFRFGDEGEGGEDKGEQIDSVEIPELDTES